MESIVARAFKSSCFFSEIAVKSANPQALSAREDCSLVSAAGEDFSVVDEYFDLQGLSEEEEENNCSSSLSLSSQDHIDDGSSFSGAGISDIFSASDGLAIPVDDMKELELWSTLMDDTVRDDIFAVKTGSNAENRVQSEPEVKPATIEAICSRLLVQTKPRSKRIRTVAGSFSSCSQLKPDYSSSASSSSSAPGFVIQAVLEIRTGDAERNERLGGKKMKRNGGSATEPVQQRRCTHCLVQKTPQWRTGPLGPKTLCNACGVRFKSGRLFPEYRPACSPTFSNEVHSNSHRKVLEMREKKIEEATEPGVVN